MKIFYLLKSLIIRIMKFRFFFISLFFLLVGELFSQDYFRSAYFLQSYRYRHVMNPSFQPERGYVGVPILGSFPLILVLILLLAISFRLFMEGPFRNGKILLTRCSILASLLSRALIQSVIR